MRSAVAAFLFVAGLIGGLVALSAAPAIDTSPVTEASVRGSASSIESPLVPATLSPRVPPPTPFDSPQVPQTAPPSLSPPATPFDIDPDIVVARPDPRPRMPGTVEDLVGDLGSQLTDPRLAGLDVGVSVWMEDYGVMFTHNPQLALFPASNQKLMTGVGVLGLLPADFRFVTEIALAGDDLIVVAGGDPTLRTADLDRLAKAVVRAGVTEVTGRLVVDATRYESARIAPGWQDWQMPRYVGPLSTLIVDDNRHRIDVGYLAEPDLGNAELLRAALGRAGVTVTGPTILGVRPLEATTLTTLDSAGRDALVARLLTSSDNEIAEALVREIGFVTGGVGSTLSGLAAIEEYVASLGVTLTGQSGDGSGLSRSNLRSATEWEQLLVAAMEADWWPTLRDSLAVAGTTGTLAGRLGGDVTAGNVRAKTGSIIGGRSLSGVLEDRTGQLVVFSFIVNGETAGKAIPVIDRFVETLAAHGQVPG